MQYNVIVSERRSFLVLTVADTYVMHSALLIFGFGRNKM